MLGGDWHKGGGDPQPGSATPPHITAPGGVLREAADTQPDPPRPPHAKPTSCGPSLPASPSSSSSSSSSSVRTAPGGGPDSASLDSGGALGLYFWGGGPSRDPGMLRLLQPGHCPPYKARQRAARLHGTCSSSPRAGSRPPPSPWPSPWLSVRLSVCPNRGGSPPARVGGSRPQNLRVLGGAGGRIHPPPPGYPSPRGQDLAPTRWVNE